MMKQLTFLLSFFYLGLVHAEFSNHFVDYLQKNNPSLVNKKPAFGGKENSKEKIVKTPIILIHGNSDMAYSSNFPMEDEKWGWNNLIIELQKAGYKRSEIYAFTWGNMDARYAIYNYHSYKTLSEIRNFVEAVKKYTGAKMVNVISHSMGVTLARGALSGGEYIDYALPNKKFNLGDKLEYIDKFIGIAGANLGITNCYNNSFYPTCSKTNGFFPHSEYLRTINGKEEKLANKIYSICTKSDEIIGNNLLVLGKNSCYLPNQDGKILFTNKKYSHFEVKTKTSKDVLTLLNI